MSTRNVSSTVKVVYRRSTPAGGIEWLGADLGAQVGPHWLVIGFLDQGTFTVSGLAALLSPHDGVVEQPAAGRTRVGQPLAAA